MFRLLLRKFGMSLLTLVNAFLGVFLWALTLYPFNFPYLLKLPQYTNEIIMTAFVLIFLSVITVTVRTKWCYEKDLFFLKKGEEGPPLIVRIVTSQEFIGDTIVCAFWTSLIVIRVGVGMQAPFLAVVLVTSLLTVGVTAVYGMFDCLLYIIARKRADRRLRRRDENL